ncbi:MAG: DNA mismatch repair protein MutS, partial [Planctomyces sp.]
GSRLLAEWLSSPLLDLQHIGQRQDAVEELLGDLSLREDLRGQLKQTWDLQRLTSRVATGRCSPRDLVCLARTLEQLPKLRARLVGRRSARLQMLEQRVELCPEVHAAITAAIVENPPATA